MDRTVVQAAENNTPSSYKVYLDSSHIECRPNLVQLSKVHIYLVQNSHAIVNDPSIADFTIVNTCGFTASRESHTINLLNMHKKHNAKVISIGCLNKINKELVSSCSHVTMISNLNKLDEFFYQKVKFSDVPEAYIDEEIDIKSSADQPSFRILTRMLHPILKKSDLYRKIVRQVYRKDKVYVEIGTGCVGNCSYCIIKKAKGNPVSRNPKDILNDMDKVYQPGKQLDLVADDCGSYGVDTGTNLPALLREISEKYPDLPIDISYLNPLWLTRQETQYRNAFKETKINSINLTIQSGSNKTIRRMNRKYDVSEILAIMKTLKSISPTTIFWTHVIVGFPGETLDDFVKTLSIMRHFEAVGVYLYSDREGTKCAEFENKNSPFVKSLKYGIASIFAKINSSLKIAGELIKHS